LPRAGLVGQHLDERDVVDARHMFHRGCGYALANAGHDTRRIQDWLGHRWIQHTTRYMQLSAAPFKGLWR
jgi:site-specific recombinase XerD